MKNFYWASSGVCVESVSATAVYEGENGHMVIRQERAWNDDNDPVTLLPMNRVSALIAALRKVMKERRERGNVSAY